MKQSGYTDEECPCFWSAKSWRKHVRWSMNSWIVGLNITHSLGYMSKLLEGAGLDFWGFSRRERDCWVRGYSQGSDHRAKLLKTAVCA